MTQQPSSSPPDRYRPAVPGAPARHGGALRFAAAFAASLAAALAAALVTAPAAARANDYPTETTADYVLACMAANGETGTALQQCACSIDIIASLISYDDYTEAETVLRMRQISGEGMEMFRSMPITSAMVDKLRNAQAEAEIRCFH